MSKAFKPFAEGFFGSFRLVVAIALAISGVAAAFINLGSSAAVEAAKNLRQHP